jgi:ABC-type transport system substrate-binding protein
MWQQDGHFKLKINGGDYNAWYQPTYLRGRAQWEGIAWTPGGTPGNDIDIGIWGWYAPGARNDGIYAWDRVPGLENVMKRHRRESDVKKRQTITQELQKLLAKEMPSFPFPGLATTFNLYWPFMGNAGWYRYPGSNNAAHQATLLHTWYDKSKAT